MKIKEYRTFVIGTPWRNPNDLVLELEDGTIGYGVSRILGNTHTVVDFLKDVQRHIIGQDVHYTEDLHRGFTLLDFGSAGEVMMTGLALAKWHMGLHWQARKPTRLQGAGR